MCAYGCVWAGRHERERETNKKNLRRKRRRGEERLKSWLKKPPGQARTKGRTNTHLDIVEMPHMRQKVLPPPFLRARSLGQDRGLLRCCNLPVHGGSARRRGPLPYRSRTTRPLKMKRFTGSVGIGDFNVCAHPCYQEANERSFVFSRGVFGCTYVSFVAGSDLRKKKSCRE